MIQVRLKETVRRIRTDNGTEFVNQTLREYYEKVGISHETSVARSPQQNGVVERRNRTLIEAARTMLIYAKAPLFLWAEAVATACYTQNRSMIRRRHGLVDPTSVHHREGTELHGTIYVDDNIFAASTPELPVDLSTIWLYACVPGIRLGLNIESNLKRIWLDADHAGCQDTRRSHLAVYNFWCRLSFGCGSQLTAMALDSIKFQCLLHQGHVENGTVIELYYLSIRSIIVRPSSLKLLDEKELNFLSTVGLRSFTGSSENNWQMKVDE
ncbi:retrovirus-related pol polyprotein from transposon TNT 1-94 [Tanacetum coccineum]